MGAKKNSTLWDKNFGVWLYSIIKGEFQCHNVITSSILWESDITDTACPTSNGSREISLHSLDLCVQCSPRLVTQGIAKEAIQDGGLT